ncbi:MAG TPA: flagellar assembly protein FliW [Lachnospiraceae bacterium]|nr:flagellar assembly protein FliW [Lachnospiraceae bacterium]
MEINSKYFSMIEYSKEDIVTFDDGLYGFQDKKNFILICFENTNDNFLCMQSIDDEKLAFLMINPYHFLADYEVVLSDEDTHSLNITNVANVRTYAVCVVGDDANKSTANLKCPIIINSKNNKAKQIILDESAYSFYQPFTTALAKEG